MKQVQTVLGPVPVDNLGMTLMHEHLVIGWPGWVFDPLARFDRLKVTGMLVDRLHALKTLGVSTFVDPCPIELGRNPELAAEVAEATGMNIICATGLYEITRHEEKSLRAAGRAHRATGAPILTHTESATMGNEQLDILASEGVDFGRVII